MRTEHYLIWKRTKNEVERRILTLKKDQERTHLALKELQKQYAFWKEQKNKENIGVHACSAITKKDLQRLSELHHLQQQEIKTAEREHFLLQQKIDLHERSEKQGKQLRSVFALGGIITLLILMLFLFQYLPVLSESGSSLTGAVVSAPELSLPELINESTDPLDTVTVPEQPAKGYLKKNKTLDDLINETKTHYPKERIKEIRQMGYASEEIVFNDKSEKALVIHEPRFDGKAFAEAIPLESKDYFTYSATLEGTTVEIEFDNAEIKEKKAKKLFQKFSESSSDSWKIKYNFLLPGENFTARLRISSNSPITVSDPLLGEMSMGQFLLSFRAEYQNGYVISTKPANENIVFVYLAKNYSAEGKTIDDPIIIDPTLTIGSAIRTRVCGDVQGFDVVDVQNGGVLEICPLNDTSRTTSGWVNFSLGYFGNFSVSPTGMVEGKGAGGLGGAGCGTNSCTSKAGINGTGQNVTASATPNGGGGGGGATKGSPNKNSAGGGGGGFGGAGGLGGLSASGTQSAGGLTYGGDLASESTTQNASERLWIGSGGGGSSGDDGIIGGAGGGSILLLVFFLLVKYLQVRRVEKQLLKVLGRKSERIYPKIVSKKSVVSSKFLKREQKPFRT